jgi:hypothetical protein
MSHLPVDILLFAVGRRAWCDHFTAEDEFRDLTRSGCSLTRRAALSSGGNAVQRIEVLGDSLDKTLVPLVRRDQLLQTAGKAHGGGRW